MNKKKLFEVIYIILIISLLIFMIWIVSFLKGNAKECLADPIAYFEVKNDGAVCNCYKGTVPYRNSDPNGQFRLNMSEISYDKT